MGVKQLYMMLFRCFMLEDGGLEDTYFVLVAITRSYIVDRRNGSRELTLRSDIAGSIWFRQWRYIEVPGFSEHLPSNNSGSSIIQYMLAMLFDGDGIMEQQIMNVTLIPLFSLNYYNKYHYGVIIRIPFVSWWMWIKYLRFSTRYEECLFFEGTTILFNFL